MQNRKDVNRISFLNRGYAFKGLLAVKYSKIARKIGREGWVNFSDAIFGQKRLTFSLARKVMSRARFLAPKLELNSHMIT